MTFANGEKRERRGGKRKGREGGREKERKTEQREKEETQEIYPPFAMRCLVRLAALGMPIVC